MRSTCRAIQLVFVVFSIAGCEPTDFKDLVKRPSKIADKVKEVALSERRSVALPLETEVPDLVSMLESSKSEVDFRSGFQQAIQSAIETDPEIVMLKKNLMAQSSAIKITESQKDFQVYGSLMGGIEDVTDETAGIGVMLNADRMLSDGGVLDAQIISQRYRLQSDTNKLKARMDQRAVELSHIWIDLERYEALNEKIESRLMVLGPLIQQLEKVADAGLGDVSQVAAAQRTVTSIRVTKEDVSQKLEKARVDFINAFGALPNGMKFDSDIFKKRLPNEINDDLANSSPMLRADYFAQKSAEADLAAIVAKEKFSVGFQARLSRPLGESGLDSEERVGIIARKTFYNGNKLSVEIDEAESRVASSKAKLQATFREGKRSVEKAQQSIKSMNKAIELARADSQVATEEISYLRQQLVIGGSTLDSVLTAEAHLYDAEAKEINFLAEKRKSELIILGTFGLLGLRYEMQADRQ